MEGSVSSFEFCVHIHSMNNKVYVCQKLKQEYDVCFNAWFCENFLKGNADDSMCAPLFKAYQECIKKTLRDERSVEQPDDKQRYPWLFF